MFERVLAAIRAHERIIIHRHSRPDGDAIGSQTGLKQLILANFPGKEVYSVGDDPARYGFIEGSAVDAVSDAMYKGALAIILDCGGASLISDSRYALADTTARIDHHLFTGSIADIEVIRPEYESCCGMITALAMEAGFKPNRAAAKALFTGMVTDSGRFRYDTTNADTFTRAAYLMQAGFGTDEIYIPLYEDDLSRVQLRAHFVGKIKLTEHNVAYIYTDRAELKSLGADEFSVSRGMANVMSDIKGVSIWVNFTETEGGVLCELRSSRHNINPVAVKYGGGGHAKASGATVADRETAMQMLNDLDKMSNGAEI